MSDDAAALPAPLTPPECDLRGLEYMPLFIQHWRGSTVNMTATDAEHRARFTLFCAAWYQVPAGSLPNDDAALCMLADLGRDLGAWATVKAAALRGYVLCSDGRLYHHFLCEQARVALATRQAWRLRQAAHRAKKKTTKDVTGDVTVTSPHGHRNVTDEGKGRDVPDLKVRDVPSLRPGVGGTSGQVVPMSLPPARGRTQQPKDKQPLDKKKSTVPFLWEPWGKPVSEIRDYGDALGCGRWDPDGAEEWGKYLVRVANAAAKRWRDEGGLTQGKGAAS